MPTNKVLIIDDDEAIRKMVLKKLSLAGIGADEAGSAEEGLEVLQQNLYSVVILDIHLPGKNGPEMIASLKMINPVLQVIMLTSDDSFERIVDCLDRGAVDFFSKDTEQVNLLVEVVSAALGRTARWASAVGWRKATMRT